MVQQVDGGRPSSLLSTGEDTSEMLGPVMVQKKTRSDWRESGEGTPKLIKGLEHLTCEGSL